MTGPPIHAAGSSRRAGRDPVAVVGCALALACALVLALSGFGYRWGWWGLGTAFRILQWGTYAGIVAVLACLGGIVRAWRRGPERPGWLPAAGLVASIAVLAIPCTYLWRARHVPPIHDVTTDTEDPPGFVAVLPLRANARNSAAYGGVAVAALQRAAYPDIHPALLAEAPAPVFRRTLAAARAMGWDIVAADSAAGRIEATATTFWYGFKDDVVIRLTPQGEGTRLDVRSASRVGRSDIGTNARRVRAYLAKVTASPTVR